MKVSGKSMKEKTRRRYRDILEEYRFDPDIMNDDDELVRRLKYIVNRRLDTADRTIMILYADCGSYRELAEMLGISHSTIGKVIKGIRRKIRVEYERIYGNADGVGGYGVRR